jgi:hypothetical protein
MATSARPRLPLSAAGASVLARQPKAIVVLIGWGLILLIGGIDYWLGAKISLSAFHLIPIAIVSWFAGRRVGLITCVISSLVWLAAQILAPDEFAPRMMRYWGSVLWLASYTVTAWLLTELHRTRLGQRVPTATFVPAHPDVAGQRRGHELKKSSAIVASPAGPLVLHVVWQQSQQQWAYWVSAAGVDSPQELAPEMLQARAHVLEVARTRFHADTSTVAWRTSLLPAVW